MISPEDGYSLLRIRICLYVFMGGLAGKSSTHVVPYLVRMHNMEQHQDIPSALVAHEHVSTRT